MIVVENGMATTPRARAIMGIPPEGDVINPGRPIEVGVLLLSHAEWPLGIGRTLVEIGALKPIGQPHRTDHGTEVYGLCTMFPKIDPTKTIPRYRLAVRSEGMTLVLSAEEVRK